MALVLRIEPRLARRYANELRARCNLGDIGDGGVHEIAEARVNAEAEVHRDAAANLDRDRRGGGRTRLDHGHELCLS
jgi:hypothetical protein